MACSSSSVCQGLPLPHEAPIQCCKVCLCRIPACRFRAANLHITPWPHLKDRCNFRIILGLPCSVVVGCARAQSSTTSFWFVSNTRGPNQSNRIDHCTAVPYPVKCSAGTLFNRNDHCTVKGQSSGSVTLKLSPHDIFICNFSICVKSVSNVDNLWSLGKKRYQNVDKEIPQNSVLIMLPYNNRIYDSSFKCGLFKCFKCVVCYIHYYLLCQQSCSSKSMAKPNCSKQTGVIHAQ